MAEQQLIDYIKKAKDAGQTDDQTRNLLSKNGWTEAEVSDAFASLTPAQPKPQPQVQPQQPAQPQFESKPQPQPQSQPVNMPKTDFKPQVISQPEPELQPKIIRPEPQYKPEPLPQYQPSQSASSVQNNMSQVKPRSHLLSKVLIALVVVVIMGGILFSATQYLNLSWSQFLSFSWNPFSGPKPETVINNMLASMKNVKSSHTTMQLQAIATKISDKTPEGQLALNTNSEMDITDAGNPKASGNFTVNLTIPGSASPYVLATVSTAVVNGVSYLKINDITIPSSFNYGGSDIAKIKGKWFKIDQDSIKALSKVQNNQIETLNISQANASNLSKKIQDLIATENIFSVKKQLNDEIISGQNTYHYLVAVDKNKLSGLVGKIILLGMQQAASSSDNSGLFNQSTVQGFINNFMNSIGDINVEIWVGKTDYMLYRAKLDKSIDLSKIIPGFSNQLEIKFDMTNSNFDKPIIVQTPTDSQKIEEVVLPLLKMQKIKSDIGQIGSKAQSLYITNKSYSSLCNRGLLNGYLANYGKDLISLNNDIIIQGARRPACYSNAQNYCASTQLSDGTYYCAGPNSSLGKINCTSALTVCQ